MFTQRCSRSRLLGVWSALVAVGSLLLAPGLAHAGSPFPSFVAQGPFIISLGYGIHPAGNSGRFVVPSRRVFGWLAGSVNAPFMIDFATNVPIATQSGNIHGELVVCENAFLIPGLEILGCLDLATVDLGAIAAGDPTSLDTALVSDTAVTRRGRVHLVSSLGAGHDSLQPLLNVDGVFTLHGGGTDGNGDVQGFLTLILNLEGHIVGLGESNLALCGRWADPAAGAACPFQQ